jgi:stage IV sporulation protein A
VASAEPTDISLNDGTIEYRLTLKDGLFYRVLGEASGQTIDGEAHLFELMKQLVAAKREYDRVAEALDSVRRTGYGMVAPSMEELQLMEPELVRQGAHYGVRMKASAPSIHMMRADITTEVAPVVGSEKQSEELVSYLLKGFEEDPASIWDSNIFGKSLHELVNEGLHAKLGKMPAEARLKLQETLERVINEGCSGLICFIL